jgi:hypothetical protein
MSLGRNACVVLFGVLTAGLAFAGCASSGTGKNGSTARAPAKPGATSEDAALADENLPPREEPHGPAITVTWEALAVEREQAENPRFGRKMARGAIENEKIVLVNESHPEAKKSMRGRTAYAKDGVSVAVISDRDMNVLMQGFQQAGFYRLARSTPAMEPLFDKPDSRGRITVERDGRSLSIVSMRGQGLRSDTRDVPATYSALKQAIAAMRNATPTLSVSTAQASGTAAYGR